jgi:hypothetical protein
MSLLCANILYSPHPLTYVSIRLSCTCPFPDWVSSIQLNDWLRAERPGFDSRQTYGSFFSPPCPKRLWGAPGVLRAWSVGQIPRHESWKLWQLYFICSVAWSQVITQHASTKKVTQLKPFSKCQPKLIQLTWMSRCRSYPMCVQAVERPAVVTELHPAPRSRMRGVSGSALTTSNRHSKNTSPSIS